MPFANEVRHERSFLRLVHVFEVVFHMVKIEGPQRDMSLGMCLSQSWILSIFSKLLLFKARVKTV